MHTITRDGVYQNILMDGSSLYPTGFHPVQLNQQRDIRKDAQPYARFTAPKPVRYYFVSFGVAHYVDDRSQPESGLSPKTLEGYDIIVPELQDGSEPYDPFSLDIFLLGDFFKRHMYEVSRFTLKRHITLIGNRGTPTSSFWPLLSRK